MTKAYATLLPFPRPESYEEFLEHILMQIVNVKGDLEVTELDDSDCMRFLVIANKSDHGKIIGHHGSVVAAICKVLSAMAGGKFVKIDVRDENDAPSPIDI